MFFGGIGIETLIFHIDADNIDQKSIEAVVDILKKGELVAIPTETVYGLAANALDCDAVNKIFVAKGRPQDNPLIVHISDISWVGKLVKEVPPTAQKLFDAFWPGPLTVILPCSDIVPKVVTAGLDTVAIRMPSHKIALEIIKQAGFPLAAPSANISGSPSPTTAKHCFADLDGKIKAIVDGGICKVGVESTVISIASEKPTLLRPGGITLEQLQAVLGEVVVDKSITSQIPLHQKVHSPGIKYKHYAPKAKVVVVKGEILDVVHYINENADKDCAVLCFEGEEKLFNLPCLSYGAKNDAAAQAKYLFWALRESDKLNVKTIYARCPEISGIGLAVYNRLLRAAAFEVIEL
jgi:L-threonylcarbamoyladenylate synthase